LQVLTSGILVYTSSPQEKIAVNLIHMLWNMQLLWAETSWVAL